MIMLGALLVACIAGCGGGDGGGGGASGSTAPSVPPGKLDVTFAGTGRITVADTEFFVDESTVDNAGNVYLVGSRIAKLGRDGVKDPQYGANLSLGFTSSPVLDEAGNLYVLAAAGVYKLDASGNLVASFGNAGLGAIPIAPPGNGSTIGFLRRDSKGFLYVVRGTVSCGPPSGALLICTLLAISRLDPNGHVDATFGAAGVKVFPDVRVYYPLSRGSLGPAISAEFSRDDELIVAAQKNDGLGTVLRKLDRNGDLTAGFDPSGVAALPCELSHTIAIDSTGNVFLGGYCTSTPSTGNIDASIAKIDPRGRLDASFGAGGVKRDVFPAPATRVAALALAANGSLYAAAGDGQDFRVAKMDARAEHVATFGNGGVATFDVGCDFGKNLDLDGAGMVYLGGFSYDFCPAFNSPPGYRFSVFRMGG